MQADPVRGQFTEFSTDGIVMSALAGLSTLMATHRLANIFSMPHFILAGITGSIFINLLFFGMVSHFAFSFSLLHDYRVRSRSMLLMSLLGSCALMTYIFAFYLVRSHQVISYESPLVTFFVSAFVYQAVRYHIHFAQLARHRETVLILGTGREAQKIWKHIRIHCDKLVSFKGFVRETASRDAAPDVLVRTVGSIESLEEFLHHTAVDTCVLTVAGADDLAFAEAAKRITKECGSRLLCAQEGDQHPPFTGRFHIASHGYVELDRLNVFARTSHALKAVADRALAGAALLALIPITLPLLLLYQLILGEFPLVGQTAYGYHRHRFTMWDLRIVASRHRLAYDTSKMRLRRMATAQAKLLARVGYFLKISGLARAPRLWNVFVGDMSLVGPRPMLQTQIPIGAAAGLLRRYTMRPGLCWPKPGAAQTEAEATLCYLEDWSLALDWRTFTHWVRSRVRRTLHAISAPLLPDHVTLAEPTRRTG